MMDIKMLDKCQTRLNSGCKYPRKIIAEFIAAKVSKPVAAYMTYAHYAGKVMKRYTKLLERKGVDIVATELLRRDLLPQGVDAFVDRAMDAVEQRSTT